MAVSTLLLILTLPPEIYPSARAVAYGLASVSFLGLCLAGTVSFSRWKLGGFVFLFCLPLVLSGAGTVSPGRTLESLAGWVFILLMYGCATAARGLGRELALVTLLSVSFHLVCPLYQKAIGFKIALKALDQLPVIDPVVAQMRLESGRVFSTFILPSHLGLFHCMALPFVFYLVRRTTGFPRIWAACLIPLQFVVIFLTRSYSSVFVLGTALAIFTLALASSRRVKWTLSIACLAGVVVLMVIFGVLRGTSPFEADHGGSASMRWRNQARAVEMLVHRPALGYGCGTFGTVYPRFMKPGDNPTRYAHNSFLQLGAEAGAFALVASILLAAACLLSLARDARGPGGSMLPKALFFSLCVFWLNNLLDFTLFLPSLAGLAFFLIGLCGGAAAPAQPAREALAWKPMLVILLGVGAGGWITARASMAEAARDRARARFEGERVEPFVEHARRAAALWPYDARYHLEQANLLAEQDSPASMDKARAAYKTAADVDPWCAPAHFGYGMSLIRSGAGLTAVDELSEAAGLHPAHGEYTQAAARARAAIAQAAAGKKRP